MIDYLGSLRANGLFAVLLYWLPMASCLVFYTARTARGYMRDKARRAGADGAYYVPSETVGGILGRALVSIVPVANLWAAFFDLAPNVFERLFEWIGATFNQPLVPDSDAAKAARNGGKS